MKKLSASLVLVSVIFAILLIDSCKKEPVIPTLTTSSVTNITVTSATSGGVITKDGGAAVTARGICWSTSSTPVISGSHTSDNKGTGSFTSSLVSLTPNTLYHVRAYATNSVGTAYGNEVTFTTTPIVAATLTTTAITSVTLTSAVSGGNITSDGNGTVTARGVCWATTTGPTISNSLTSDGTGTGAFTSNLTGLLPGTIYYVRAYATNSAATAYGNEVSFTTSPIVVPTLTTTAATAITLTTATAGGNITADGGGAVTARGTCWATTQNPTTANFKTTDATGTGVFTSSLTALLPSTTYHIRAYATNSAGTAYGNDLTFTTGSIAVPTVTTTAATLVTLTTAVTGGNVTADGGGTVSAKGVCWATAPAPTIAGSKTTDGTGTGVFTSNLSALLPGTIYYVRAYATNSAGTAYGNEISFTTTAIVVATLTTTAATAITLTTATAGGNITADGGGAVTVRGTCWAITLNPTITDAKTTDGTGTGIFTSSLTGLLPGTIYHIRAYATNSAGTAYGNDLTFTTNPVVIPTITTTSVTSITQTTAASGGNVTADGGGTVSAKGVCWAITANPTITNFKTSDGTGTGSFTSNLSPLLPGTTYHVRAYATNSAGTAYGSDVSFTTNPILVPTLTTAAVTSITQTTAVSGGNVSADGGGTVSARGVCWAITANPSITDAKTTNGTGTGIFTSNITPLLPGTIYHVRAYATNSAGTAYGNDISFTTNPILVPTLTTAAVTSITLTSAVSGGNVSADGGGTVSARGVCWAITANPTITDAKTSNGTGTGAFTSNLTPLLSGTTYYVRAYATNSAGTAYGNQLSFTTVHETSTVTDNDGNTYNTVKIGDQWWMAENLKTTKLNDNTPILNITDNATWAGDSILMTPAYCWYSNDAATYKATYGALYNWFTVNTGKLCPSGWHAPTDTEYNTLEMYLGIPPAQVDLYGWRGTDQGAQMKSATGWAAGQDGTNISGFTALPGGYRYAATGTFNDLGNLSYWWTTTEDIPKFAWYRRLDGTRADVFKAVVQKTAGKYVRCVMD